MEPENITLEIWLIATLFGGAGAAIVKIIYDWWNAKSIRKRIKNLIVKELNFNAKQIQKTINDLNELKEDYIKCDRASHFPKVAHLKVSTAVYKHLFTQAIVYEYINDEDLGLLDEVFSQNSQLMIEEQNKIFHGEYDKPKSLSQVEWFIMRHQEYLDNIKKVRSNINKE